MLHRWYVCEKTILEDGRECWMVVEDHDNEEEAQESMQEMKEENSDEEYAVIENEH